jgi:hypothetical protein
VNEPAADGFRDHDLHAWPMLSPLLVQGGYLPWTTGSMRPAGLVAVCNEIVHGARIRIVECGSGVSTVLLARLLRELNVGGLIALEHDRHWAALVQAQLQRETLEGIARVVHAPLQGDPPWYGLNELSENPNEIDLLIVDGPPACGPGQGASREPALAQFAQQLTANAAVILDDINRPGERAIIARWEASTNWRFALDEPAGVAVGHRVDSP